MILNNFSVECRHIHTHGCLVLNLGGIFCEIIRNLFHCGCPLNKRCLEGGGDGDVTFLIRFQLGTSLKRFAQNLKCIK